MTHERFTVRRNVGRGLLILALLAASLLLVPRAHPVAADAGTCIDDVTGRTNVCTANDVRISELRNAVDLECTVGTMVDLNLRATLVGEADERYDIGMFVALDGGNARTGSCHRDYLPPPLSGGGTCSISGTPCKKDADCPAPPQTCVGGYNPTSGSGPFYDAEVQEDPDDECGDIEKNVMTLYDLNTISVPCLDSNGDGFLDVGTCVSWDNNKKTLCVDVNGAVPNTKSKCRCETIKVGNVIVVGDLAVQKVADPTSVNEPGGEVTFTFTVSNPSQAQVTVQTLIDSVYGNLTTYPGTTCILPVTLAPGGSYSCSIPAYISGPPGAQTDVVTATGVDESGTPLTAMDSAEVTILDLLPLIDVVKTADPTEVEEPGGLVLYKVVIANNSGAGDPVTLTSLEDDIYGDLTDPDNPDISDSTCTLVTIQPGGTHECSFKAQVSGTAGTIVTDTVTAVGVDDEGNPAEAADDASVEIVPLPAIGVTKTVVPPCVLAPGGEAVFAVQVVNQSSPGVPLSLISLTDDLYDDITNPANTKILTTTCELGTIQPAETYECRFKAKVIIGKKGGSQTDTVTATAVDPNGHEVQDSGSATVTLCELPPDTGVPLAPPLVAGGLGGLGLALMGVGVLLRRRSR